MSTPFDKALEALEALTHDADRAREACLALYELVGRGAPPPNFLDEARPALFVASEYLRLFMRDLGYQLVDWDRSQARWLELFKLRSGLEYVFEHFKHVDAIAAIQPAAAELDGVIKDSLLLLHSRPVLKTGDLSSIKAPPGLGPSHWWWHRPTILFK